MAAYRWVYDSRHLQAVKNWDQLRNPTLGNEYGLYLLAIGLLVACDMGDYVSCTAKEFWKSIQNWQSRRHQFGEHGQSAA